MEFVTVTAKSEAVSQFFSTYSRLSKQVKKVEKKKYVKSKELLNEITEKMKQLLNELE